ncbi:hypothetical protein KFZ70_14505 [Tamlana fucoidanivorans]|uniref:Uncharacterized protein n=1 Tax=Allotamlana fucoidanivorans TaxID=2583814 RepID=A0A5C4SHB0_9FLAO|nr:hypothetical protein [Tamlana fucoidanivorans]TNJ42390.1 hypothetical protein FGF67_14040 [Tamlana fucoidanivorans]
MKTINKILGLILLVVVSMSCEEDERFAASDIKLKPIYAITDINKGGPERINVYKEKQLVVTHLNSQSLIGETPTDYTDTSSETDYNFEWTVERERPVFDEDGQEVVDENGNVIMETYTVQYTANASKEDGIGTMEVISTYKEDPEETVLHDVTISEEEVYN